jgi:hypothetical protein
MSPASSCLLRGHPTLPRIPLSTPTIDEAIAGNQTFVTSPREGIAGNR